MKDLKLIAEQIKEAYNEDPKTFIADAIKTVIFVPVVFAILIYSIHIFA